MSEEENTEETAPEIQEAVTLNIETESRGKIYGSILETVGGTPLVRLPNITKKYDLKAEIVAKLEFFNPHASTKDRVALAMFEAAESTGKIIPGKTILIEPSAGSTASAIPFLRARLWTCCSPYDQYGTPPISRIRIALAPASVLSM